MQRHRWLCVVGALVATVVTLAAQKQTLTDVDKVEAIRVDLRRRARSPVLDLSDSGQVWANAFSAALAGPYQHPATNRAFRFASTPHGRGSSSSLVMPRRSIDHFLVATLPRRCSNRCCA